METYPNNDGLASYQLNQTHKQQLFQTENEQPPPNMEFGQTAGCVGSYPSSFSDGLKPPKYGFDYGSNIQDVPTLQEGFGNILDYKTQEEGFGNNTVNDPTNDLLDINSRPITDFVHNNMVPFYGSAVKQNMAGTGIKSGNYIEDVDVSSGFDNTTPYQDKLNVFTGLDDTYLYKRESGPNFSPAEQQSGWVHGMPAFRPDDDRYKQSMFIRNDLAPCEKEMVGPGLDIGADIPASGGFHDLTRINPNNVNDYKANQLLGRVNAGKSQLGGQEPTSYPGVGLGGSLNGGDDVPGVVKNRPDSFYSQIRRPTMTAKIGIIENEKLSRPDYTSSFKPGNAKRAQTNYGFGSLVIPGTQTAENNQYNSVPFNNLV